MTAILAPSAKQQFLTNSGVPAAGYRLYVYTANTTTPATTYQDRAGSVPNANPIILDARGEATVYLTPGAVYDFVLKTDNDALVWTREDVSGQQADTLTFTQSGDGAQARSVESKLRDQVSVEDFGAVGDGVTDDGPAIQDAIDYASANKLTLHFSGKTYLVKSYIDIKSNTSLRGTIGTVVFIDKACTLGDVIGGGARAVFTKNGVSNISLDSIAFKSTKTGLTQGVSIALWGVTNLRITNCEFSDFGDTTYYAQGLIIFGGSNIHITDSKFSNNSGDGLALSNSSNKFYISGCEFSSNVDWGLALVANCYDGTVTDNVIKDNTSTGTGVDRCQNVTFTNNKIYNNEHGIRLAMFDTSGTRNEDIVMTGNIIKNTSVAGISVEDMEPSLGKFTIIGNTIEGSTNQGIRVIDAELGAIVGNVIYSCGAEGILLNAVDATVGWNTGFITIVGNHIRAVTWGIRQITTGGTQTIVVAMGNQVIAASSGTMSLPTNAQYADPSESANYVSVHRSFNFPSGIVHTTATGGGTVPPANVQGYLPIYLNGTRYKVPYYNN